MSSSKRKITMSASRRSRSIDRDNDIHSGDYRQSPAQHQPRSRPSVFSRLGTKRSPGPTSSGTGKTRETLCRNIIENGTCPYGNKCKYGHNCHKRDDRIKTVAGLKGKRRDSPNIDTDWQNWNEDSLDYEDENILEKRRQLLEKELAKEDSDEDKKFPKTSKRDRSPSSSSSSSSSSTSESRSSSSSDTNAKPSSAKRAKISSSSRQNRESSVSSNDSNNKSSKKEKSSLKKKSLKKKTKLQQKSKDGKKSKLKGKKQKSSPSKSKKNVEKKRGNSSPSTRKDIRESNTSEPSKTVAIRKGAEVDKFGFYHAAQPTTSNPSSMSHDVLRIRQRNRKEIKQRKHRSRTLRGSKHGSKRSTSSERKAVTPPNSHSKRPKRRSSASPPRKRRLSPPLPKSTKPSYTAATSRSGGNKSGGDRDLREQQRPSRSNWNSSKAGRSSLSPQRQQRKISKAGKKGQGTGANAVSIDDITRRGSSSGGNRKSPGGLRRNRSRSDERLLPPQALQLKNPPTATSSQRQSSERSNKGSRERSLPLIRSPENLRPHSKTETGEQADDPDVSAADEPMIAQSGELSAEEFSDIGDSGEEFILNQDNETQDDDGDKEELVDDHSNSEPVVEDKEQPIVDDDHVGRDQSMSKESDLLEGISEEEFELSDEDVDKDNAKLKVADALGVDWSQLITPKGDNSSNRAENVQSFRNQWTPEAIFSKIGLPKSLMRPGHYEQILERLNKDKKGEDEEHIKMHHPIAAIHAFHHDKLEKSKADSLRRKPALSARSDLQQRRKLLGLTELQNPIELNIY